MQATTAENSHHFHSTVLQLQVGNPSRLILIYMFICLHKLELDIQILHILAVLHM